MWVPRRPGDWEVHCRGIRHRRQLLSLRVHGERGRLVLSAFESPPGERPHAVRLRRGRRAAGCGACLSPSCPHPRLRPSPLPCEPCPDGISLFPTAGPSEPAYRLVGKGAAQFGLAGPGGAAPAAAPTAAEAALLGQQREAAKRLRTRALSQLLDLFGVGQSEWERGGVGGKLLPCS